MSYFEIINADRCSSSQKGCVDGCRFLGSPQKLAAPVTSEGNYSTFRLYLCANGMRLGLHELRQRWCIGQTVEKKKQGRSRLLNLLALDGGGVRGLVLIQVIRLGAVVKMNEPKPDPFFQILLALEKALDKSKILERVDWMSATSTGAIVAAAFCQGTFLDGHGI